MDKTKSSQRGFTLVELLVVVNIVAVLVGVAVIISSEFGTESRCLEIYTVLPQIIRSQTVYCMKNNRYYAAEHNDFRNYSVDLSETMYFTFSTFPNEFSSFSARADATAWAPGGWAVYNHRGDPTWTCDGVQIRRSWLPE